MNNHASLYWVDLVNEVYLNTVQTVTHFYQIVVAFAFVSFALNNLSFVDRSKSDASGYWALIEKLIAEEHPSSVESVYLRFYPTHQLSDLIVVLFEWLTA